jgi:ketosteroid isomerase-like protein
MGATDTVTQDARATVRRFIDALNARDPDALCGLITDDARMRLLTGPEHAGPAGARALIAAIETRGLRFVPLRRETVEGHGGAVHVRLPVRELIGPDDIERIAEFEIRDGRVAAFAIRFTD